MTSDHVEAGADESVGIAEEMAGAATGKEQLVVEARIQRSKAALQEALTRVKEKLRVLPKKSEERR